VALVLPGKPGSIKPVIARFFSRHVHTLCLRRKRDFATRPPRKQADAGKPVRSSSRGTAEGLRRVRYSHPFYEYLTRAAFLKMRALKRDFLSAIMLDHQRPAVY
jgi:hypothetical protein